MYERGGKEEEEENGFRKKKRGGRVAAGGRSEEASTSRLAEAPLATRCVLEGELEDQTARVSLGVHVLEPLAPRGEREAGERGVVLVPLSYELPEAVGAELPHLPRGVQLQPVE